MHRAVWDGQPDHGIRLKLMDGAIGSCMSFEHIFGNLERTLQITMFARGKVTKYIAAGVIDWRLIDGDPHIHLILQGGYHLAGELAEKINDALIFPAPPFHDPDWIGKMVQSEQGF